MSWLTKAFHRSSHQDVIMHAVKLVDDKLQSYSNEYKLEIATGIVKAIDSMLPANRMFDGVETMFLQGAISFAASWLHTELAPYEHDDYPTPQQNPPPPPVVDIYNTNRDYPVPEDSDLKAMGFNSGDQVYVFPEISKWEVTKSGALPNSSFSLLRTIA